MRSRRERICRQRRLIGIVALAAASIVIPYLLLAESVNTRAASAEPSYKYYTNIEVQKGDTLWKIAGEYITDDYEDINEYIKEVRRINHIIDDDIRSGQRITIPYYSNIYLQ